MYMQHAGFDIINAMNKGYDYHNGIVDGHVQKINQLNECIRQLTDFQQAVNAQRPTGRIELNTEAERNMVDGVRALIPNGIEEHKYIWTNEKEIDALLESVNNEIRLLTNQMSPETSKMSEAFDNRKTLITEFNKLMKELIDLVARMVRQQRV